MTEATALSFELEHDPDMDDAEAASFISNGSEVALQLSTAAWNRLGGVETLTVRIEVAPGE